MSNQLSKLKCVKSKKIQKSDIRRAMNNQKAATINFMDRVIPNSLVIDVKKSDIRIGNDTDKIKDIEVAFNAGLLNNDDSAKLLEFLAQFSEETIHKVILDNTENFKIMKLGEFVELIQSKVSNKDNPSADSKEALTYYLSERMITQSLVDSTGNIFCISCDQDFENYRLLKLNPQLTPLFDINTTGVIACDNELENEIRSICLGDNDEIAALVISGDSKYIVLYDNDLTLISTLLMNNDYDISCSTAIYHNGHYYCTGLVDHTDETYVKIFDKDLNNGKHIKIAEDGKILAPSVILTVGDTTYVGGALCTVDGRSVDGLLMTIVGGAITNQYKVSFNEKYGFIADIKLNQKTQQLVVAGISSDDDDHFKAVTMIMGLDLSVIKTKSFVSEDLKLDNNRNPRAEHQLALLDNGEIVNSIYCKTNINDLPIGGVLLLHHSADLGLIETKMIVDTTGLNRIVGNVMSYKNDIVLTLLEITHPDCNDDSAVLKIPHDKLFSKFFPMYPDGNPVDQLSTIQSDCRSFSVEDTLVSISPV